MVPGRCRKPEGETGNTRDDEGLASISTSQLPRSYPLQEAGRPELCPIMTSTFVFFPSAPGTLAYPSPHKTLPVSTLAHSVPPEMWQKDTLRQGHAGSQHMSVLK